MTNSQVIEQVVVDPLVIEKQSKMVNGVSTPPSTAALQALANGELQNSLNALLNFPPIRQQQLERVESLSTSSVTSEGRGSILTLPAYVGSVISVTSSDTQLPLTKITGLEDFDYWYSQRYKSSTAPDAPEVWVPWQVSTAQLPQILLSPGAGSAGTVKIAYVRKITQPAQMSVLPDDVHFLVVTDVKNRLTGGGYEFSFNRDLSNVAARLKRMVGGVSEMRLGDTERRMNLRLSGMTGGSETWNTDPKYGRPY